MSLIQIRVIGDIIGFETVCGSINKLNELKAFYSCLLYFYSYPVRLWR